MPEEIIIHGLSQLESREVSRALGSTPSRIEETQPVGPGLQGDAAVVNLLTQATPWVVGVIGLWLMKPRTSKTTVRRLTRVDEQGKKHDAEVRISEYSEQSPSDAVVNALAKLFGWHTEAVAGAIQNARDQ